VTSAEVMVILKAGMGISEQREATLSSAIPNELASDGSPSTKRHKPGTLAQIWRQAGIKP
jgi:hypothetical protein